MSVLKLTKKVVDGAVAKDRDYEIRDGAYSGRRQQGARLLQEDVQLRRAVRLPGRWDQSLSACPEYPEGKRTRARVNDPDADGRAP